MNKTFMLHCEIYNYLIIKINCKSNDTHMYHQRHVQWYKVINVL